MPEPKQGGGRFSVLGGSLFLKIIVLLGVFLVASTVLFGMPTELGDIFWNVIKGFIGIVLVVLVFKGIQAAFKPKPFSPTESFKKKVIRVAKLSKPFNVKKLYIRGEDMRVYSYWGKIVGLCFIPYVSSKPKKNKDGSIAYVDKRGKDGKPVKDEDDKIIKIPDRETITEKDGDWLFVIQTSAIPFLGKQELVRAHQSLCSEIGESVWIKSVNLVPIGDYFYPCQQWQDDILRILTQHQSETIVEVYEEFLDLIANVTQMSLGSDPTLQKIMLAQSEAITSGNQGALLSGR